MEKISFSAMKESDMEEVLDIENASFSLPWSRRMFTDDISKDSACFIVARLDKKIVGYGGFWHVLDEAHLGNIAVHPEYRRRGIGEGILKELVEEAKSKGANLMTLEVRECNIAGRALYEKSGFRLIAIRKGYYSDNGEDAYVYMKDI